MIVMTTYFETEEECKSTIRQPIVSGVLLYNSIRILPVSLRCNRKLAEFSGVIVAISG